MRLLLIIGLVLSMAGQAYSLERCKQYAQTVRVQHWMYWGTDFPCHYGLGQLQQESNCRSTVTAFDAGQGISQFMPKTEEYCERFLGPLNMYNPTHAIKAQAWYMRKIHKENWDGALWITYQIYNGGASNLKAERARAGVTSHSAMRTVCHRKVITLKSGRKLDFCEVNYDYSEKVFKYGKSYRIFPDGKWRYW